jgi:hypothetical protein
MGPGDGQPRRQLIETTVGRALFNMNLPAEIRFVNEVLDKGKASAVLAASIFHYGTYTIDQTKQFLAGKGVPVRL